MLKIYTRENKVKKKQKGNRIYIGMNVSLLRQMVFLAANQKQHPSMFNLCSIQPHTLIVHRYVIFIWRGLLIDKRHSFWFYSNNISAWNLPFTLHSLYQSLFLAASKTMIYKRSIKLKRKEIWNVKKFFVRWIFIKEKYIWNCIGNGISPYGSKIKISQIYQFPIIHQICKYYRRATSLKWRKS